MSDVPDRDEVERQLARKVGRLHKNQLARLLEHLGDPPRLENVPESFWRETGVEFSGEFAPFAESLYMQSAQRLMETTPIGVDWTLVNQRAADWARSYSTFLAGEINATSRGAIATQISNSTAQFFERGLTIGELERQLAEDPKLHQLFTRDVKDKLGRVYGPVRAEMIAVTEVTRASVEGERALANELARQGINMVEIWETNRDELVCPICGPKHGKERGDGWDRQDGPPAHPRCRCWTNHVLPGAAQLEPTPTRFEPSVNAADVSRWLVSQGVEEARLGDDFLIANEIGDGAQKIIDAGYPLPKKIIVDADRFEKSKFASTSDLVPGLYQTGSDAVYINPNARFWQNSAQEAKKTFEMGAWSTDSSQHPIIHEIGHYLHYQSVGNFEEAERLFAEKLTGIEQRVAAPLSQYAMYDKSEFVAEAFAAIVNGRKLPAGIMRLYERFKGFMP